MFPNQFLVDSALLHSTIARCTYSLITRTFPTKVYSMANGKVNLKGRQGSSYRHNGTHSTHLTNTCARQIRTQSSCNNSLETTVTSHTNERMCHTLSHTCNLAHLEGVCRCDGRIPLPRFFKLDHNSNVRKRYPNKSRFLADCTHLHRDDRPCVCCGHFRLFVSPKRYF